MDKLRYGTRIQIRNSDNNQTYQLSVDTGFVLEYITDHECFVNLDQPATYRQDPAITLNSIPVPVADLIELPEQPCPQPEIIESGTRVRFSLPQNAFINDLCRGLVIESISVGEDKTYIVRIDEPKELVSLIPKMYGQAWIVIPREDLEVLPEPPVPKPDDLQVGDRVYILHGFPGMHFASYTGTVDEIETGYNEGYYIVKLDEEATIYHSGDGTGEPLPRVRESAYNMVRIVDNAGAFV